MLSTSITNVSSRVCASIRFGCHSHFGVAIRMRTWTIYWFPHIPSALFFLFLSFFFINVSIGGLRLWFVCAHILLQTNAFAQFSHQACKSVLKCQNTQTKCAFNWYAPHRNFPFIPQQQQQQQQNLSIYSQSTKNSPSFWSHRQKMRRFDYSFNFFFPLTSQKSSFNQSTYIFFSRFA